MLKLRTSSRYFINALLAAGLLSSCDAYTNNGVEQKVDLHSLGLTKSGKALKTLVWYDQEIVKSWYDDLDIVTDSLVKLRQRQGDSILAALKNCR